MWLSFDAKLRIQLIPFGRQIFLLITALTNIDGNESYSRSSSSSRSSNKNNIKGEMRYVGQFIVRLKTPPLKTNKIRKFMDDKMGFPYPYPQPYPQSISALSMYMCVWVLEHGLTCTRTHLYTHSRRLLYNCGWILYTYVYVRTLFICMSLWFVCLCIKIYCPQAKVLLMLHLGKS